MIRSALEGSVLFLFLKAIIRYIEGSRLVALGEACGKKAKAALAYSFLGRLAGMGGCPVMIASVRESGLVRWIRSSGAELTALFTAESSKSGFIGKCRSLSASPLKTAGGILAVAIAANTALWVLLKQQSAAGWVIRAGWFFFALAAASSHARWQDIKSSSLILKHVP